MDAILAYLAWQVAADSVSDAARQAFESVDQAHTLEKVTHQAGCKEGRGRRHTMEHVLKWTIIGHRGAAGLRPENTLPSFQHALELGCRWLELDVHCLTDGALVVIHDEDLARTTDQQGPVAELATADIANIDAGQGTRIPHLQEVFALVSEHAKRHGELPDYTINIELKGKGTATPVAEFLGAMSSIAPAVLVSSFDHEQLRTFRKHDQQTPVAPLFHRCQARCNDIATDLDASAINMNWRILTPSRINTIREAGFRLYAYTVNNAVLATRLQRWGIDGIFTDRPDKFLPRRPA